MDTKSLIIEISTTLFQQKGYIGVGLNEILKACNISKGSLYHHFPNGKEELLVACLERLKENITEDMKDIFQRYSTAPEATLAMIEQLITNLETEGTITGYTFSSIVSEMGSLSDNIRHACAQLYHQIQDIYYYKLIEDGYSQKAAYSTAVMMTATIEGAMMLCLTQKDTEPLRVIARVLPPMLKNMS